MSVPIETLLIPPFPPPNPGDDPPGSELSIIMDAAGEEGPALDIFLGSFFVYRSFKGFRGFFSVLILVRRVAVVVL